MLLCVHRYLGVRDIKREYHLLQLYWTDMDINDKQMDLQTYQEKFNKKQADVDQLETSLSEASSALAKIKREIHEHDKLYHKTSKKNDDHSNKLNSVQEQIKHIKKTIQTQSNALNKLQEEKKSQEESIADIESRLESRYS